MAIIFSFFDPKNWKQHASALDHLNFQHNVSQAPVAESDAPFPSDGRYRDAPVNGSATFGGLGPQLPVGIYRLPPEISQQTKNKRLNAVTTFMLLKTKIYVHTRHNHNTQNSAWEILSNLMTTSILWYKLFNHISVMPSYQWCKIAINSAATCVRDPSTLLRSPTFNQYK